MQIAAVVGSFNSALAVPCREEVDDADPQLETSTQPLRRGMCVAVPQMSQETLQKSYSRKDAIPNLV